MNVAIKRMVAIILDFLLIFLVLVIVSFFIAWIIRLVSDDSYRTSMVLRAIGSWGTFAPWSATTLVALYFSWFDGSSWQATFGKKIMGLKVVDGSENRIFFWRSLGRFVLYLTVFPVSWIFILVTKNHEGLHDWMSDTKVTEA
jgi:uncharacterized RDD family membrane protein YckC